MNQDSYLSVCIATPFFFAFGVFILVGAIQQMRDGVQCFSWPQVPGKILSTAIKKDRYGRYYPEVSYSYDVEGKRFESRKISFSDILPGSCERAHEILVSFQLGTDVKVFVKPGKPRVSCLIPEKVNSNTYMAMGGGIFLMLDAIGLFVLSSIIVNGNPFGGK